MILALSREISKSLAAAHTLIHSRRAMRTLRHGSMV